MTSPISSTTKAPAAAQVAAVDPKAKEVKQSDSPAQAQPTAKTTVTVSAAAVAALAAEKEAAETPVQTAQEARGNDHQAQRLLAKQAAAKAG